MLSQLDSQTTQQELFLDLLGGGSDLTKCIIRILLIGTMSKNSKPIEGFQSKSLHLIISAPYIFDQSLLSNDKWKIFAIERKHLKDMPSQFGLTSV